MSQEVRRKKLLLLHHSGLLGGAGKSLEDLVRVFERDYDVAVYVPESPSELADYLIDNGISVKTFGFRMAKIPYYSGGERIWHPRLWFYVLSILRQASHWSRVIRSEAPVAVIANSSVLSWLSLLCRGRVSVLMVRETLHGRPGSLVNRTLRVLRERFQFVVYLSEYDRNADGLRRPTTLVVRDAVQPSNFSNTVDQVSARKELGLDAGGVFVLFLGGTTPLKGLDLLLRALAETRSQVQVLVAGNPPRPGRRVLWRISSHRRFERRVSDLLAAGGIAQRVTFIGLHRDVAKLYSACDFVVFPMRRPHQARPAFEAGFQAKPVIITDFPNICECVAHHVNGLVFRPGVASALAECLDTMARDPDLVERLGNENRRHAFACHDQSRAFDPLKRVLRSLDEDQTLVDSSSLKLPKETQ